MAKGSRASTGTRLRSGTGRNQTAEDRRLSSYPPKVRTYLKQILKRTDGLRAADRDRVGWDVLQEVWPELGDWMQNNLWIATKELGKTALFRFNGAQIRLHHLIEKAAATGKPVRIIILKARQLGMSTYIQARFFATCARTPGTFALTVGNKKDTVKHMVRMDRRFLRNLFYSPGMNEQGKFGIGFDHDSSMHVETARSGEEMGRSHTIHLLHCSELAFWPDPEAGLNALLQVQGEFPGSIVAIETTANGKNYFYRLWNEAVSGQNDFIPIFFPWFEDDSYRMPIPKETEQEFTDSLSDEEQQLQKRYHLDLEQLAWRRHTIRNKCGNSLPKFRQEYPSFPEEAFLHSSAPVFRQEHLELARNIVRKPERYDISFKA